jgi:surfeit locus 1 family protein
MDTAPVERPPVDHSFLRRPIWVLSHVLVALLILAMIGLGFWQRARYDEVSAQNERFAAQAAGAPVPIDAVVPPQVAAVGDVPDDVEFRRVSIEGTWDTANEVEIRSRSQGGAPGAWVLTPLVQADGRAVPVVRGWIPLQIAVGDPPFAEAAPPSGPVTVTGVVQLTQERAGLGGIDPPEGRLADLARVDVARFARQQPGPVVPVYVLLDTQDPPQPAGASGLPETVRLELRSASTNFSYMVQWWIFAAIAAIGYPLVLRRVAINRARGDQVPADDAAGRVGPHGDRGAPMAGV